MSARMYEILENFPVEERYGFSSQMKRASISVASNIAEGAARQSGKEFVHFLFISLDQRASWIPRLKSANWFFGMNCFWKNWMRFSRK